LGCRAAFVSDFNHHLLFFEHVQQLNPGQRHLCGIERFEPQCGTRHPVMRNYFVSASLCLVFIPSMASNAFRSYHHATCRNEVA
jgi:hypothetical protein